jgi:ferrochelatase
MAKQTPQEAHGQAQRTGILMVNLGTPEAPTPKALRRYLAEFLGDRRVVDLPRALWLPILHGIILRTRPRKSAKAYASIWTDQGSPLMLFSKGLRDQLEKQFQIEGHDVPVVLAMRYGQPSVQQGVDELMAMGVRRVLVLPLYPQYSVSTTASVFDAVVEAAANRQWVPELRFINQYFEHPAWLQAIADSLKPALDEHQPDRLLLSFHGVPKRYLMDGDPYHCQCHKSARLISERLHLPQDQWQITFQSRFGREPWLQPYTDYTLEALPEQGIKKLVVACPGFAVDCLETLEEIAMEGKEEFMEAGGEAFHYLSCLNDSAEHARALFSVLSDHLQGWPLQSEDAATLEQRVKRGEQQREALAW